MIYKIIQHSEWEAAKKIGSFTGAAIDLEDGFIHFSTAAQVRETAARHFSGVSGLLLVAIDENLINSDLKWEPSRGGDLFPHLYNALPMSAVVSEQALPWNEDSGKHEFGDLLGE